jgi:transcription termination factor Rho
MRYVESLGYNVVFHIDEINGISVDVSKVRPTLTAVPVQPNEKLDLAGNSNLIIGLQLFAPVCYGQFGVVSVEGRMNFTSQATSIFAATNKDEVCPQLFILGEKEYVINKEKEKLADYNTVYYTKMQDNQTYYLNKVLQYVSMQAKYNGSKHVVIINDLDMLDREESENGVTAMKLASYAGAYSNGGSVTIIAVANSYSPLGAYHTVRSHADFELAFKSTASIRQNVIDMLSSYSISAREVS